MNVTSRHILGFFEEWAPQSTKLEYDNVGLLVGESAQHIHRVLVCLDVTHEVLDEAEAFAADLVIAHHPLIFRKLSRVSPDEETGALIYRLIRRGMGLLAVHTNLDAAWDGVSFALASKLGLQQTAFLKPDVPLPSDESSASDFSAIHEPGIKPSITGFGVVGSLASAMPAQEFLSLVGERLSTRALRYSGSATRIERVAVCGGAGAFLTEHARQAGVQAYVTADLKYHDFFAGDSSFLLVDAGHYETEIPVVETICARLAERFPGLVAAPARVNTNPVTFFGK